jgi:7,8-dihydropterin-6-yl-methyl-4-(beta-D-ribofuranosyl)aminobenzene 5'-phosphate synthase
MEFAILSENTTPRAGITGEYGFSALIRREGQTLLFDTGSAGAIFPNARKMGIDLSQVENVIISHGHFDHTGAMPELMKLGGVKRIYIHPDAFAHRLLPLNNGKAKDIGCRFSPQQAEQAGVELVLTKDFTSIAPGVYITGQIPRLCSYEDCGGNFKVEVKGVLGDDLINDDMALVIEHPDGLIIVSGCAHAGLINTIDYALKMTGQKKILAFIGGTHLMTAGPERMRKTVQALQKYNPAHLVVAHCTGFYAAAQLYQALGPIVVKGEAGMVFKY